MATLQVSKRGPTCLRALASATDEKAPREPPNDDLELVKKPTIFPKSTTLAKNPRLGRALSRPSAGGANVLADMKMDTVAIGRGLLHDSVEDTSVTTVEIAGIRRAGCPLVEGVTKISKIDFSSTEEAQAENLAR